ncbi:MAG: ROK family protein [Verrucomicrobiae bacterium]|nr:ROK family protein [Verrucomicrobiae bacterium]NNJ42263.1 ROK family protein [Akkermansiaceae bacterium]
MSQSTHTIPTSLGIDFGGTSVKFGVVRGQEVIGHAPAITTEDYQEAEPLIDAIAYVIENLRNQYPEISAIGVGVPGFVDFPTGTIHNLTNVQGWKNIPLRDILHKRTQLPVVVENDANCMAYAEWKVGAGVGIDHLVCITLGTGVGGGIITHGHMLRGARSIAGELGQTSIDYQGRQGAYGNLGALEDYIGNNEIAAEARDVYASHGIKKSIADCTPASLSKDAAGGDDLALTIWTGIAQKLACTILNTCWILNPAAVIIGGGVAKAGEILFNPLKESIQQQLAPSFLDGLKILPAHFSNNAGIIGAGALALEEANQAE